MKLKYSALVLLAAFAATGCATSYPVGGIYTDVKLPMDSGSNATACPKMGKATANSYLTLIATGDASIQKAVQNGNITKIHYIDWDAENVLGIIGTYTTTVCGE